MLSHCLPFFSARYFPYVTSNCLAASLPGTRTRTTSMSVDASRSGTQCEGIAWADVSKVSILSSRLIT